ncbi:hypothetical protein G4B88_017357 [Cannabis sativa]|uniref:DUF4283 domain-containing protein n=1 Tax=Cannabis sativa TaxID=3483 RepID=A0A7J6F3U0_CANSA|nr:hypothetical protein G4B88_017357 [Cannabis sativa]
METLTLSLEQNEEVGKEFVKQSVVGRITSRRCIFNGLLRPTFDAEANVNGQKVDLCGYGYKPIWVRVYDVPPHFFTDKNATGIANKIGTVVSIDRRWRNGFLTVDYIRVRVEIHLSRPLLVGLFLPMEEGVSLWCYFKYENLPCIFFKWALNLEHEVANNEVVVEELARAPILIVMAEELEPLGQGLNFEPALVRIPHGKERIRTEVEVALSKTLDRGTRLQLRKDRVVGVNSSCSILDEEDVVAIGVEGPLDSQVAHLAMVFKGSLDSNAKAVMKRSRSKIKDDMNWKGDKVDQESNISEGDTNDAKDEAVNSLRSLIRSINPDMVCLMETKKVSEDMEGIWQRLGFNEGVACSSIGASGISNLGWGVRLCSTKKRKSIGILDGYRRNGERFHDVVEADRRCERSFEPKRQNWGEYLFTEAEGQGLPKFYV